MKKIRCGNWRNVPKKYTGIVEYDSGEKEYLKDGRWHREDGPARIYPNRSGFYYLNGKSIEPYLYWFLVLTFIKNKKKIPRIYIT